MKMFEITHHNTEDISGFRLGFLWIGSLTLTHNQNNGSHLNIGFGLNPFEISTQFSIWSIS